MTTKQAVILTFLLIVLAVIVGVLQFSGLLSTSVLRSRPGAIESNQSCSDVCQQSCGELSVAEQGMCLQTCAEFCQESELE